MIYLTLIDGTGIWVRATSIDAIQQCADSCLVRVGDTDFDVTETAEEIHHRIVILEKEGG